VAEKPVTVPIKKRRVVNARDLAAKELLESEANVEDYLDRLRQALEAGIRAGGTDRNSVRDAPWRASW
jgi:hypothetical protein